jgi:FemAB-related protein (PEP-CTERM system-associated)
MNVASHAPLDVHDLKPDTTERWDAFVHSCPDAGFFHLSGWKRVIEQSFGHTCHYLYAESGGTVCGVLPLVHLNSRLFGSALVSNAFCVYGGPAAADGAAAAALDQAALDLAGRLGVEHLEYRLRAPRHPDWDCNAELYVTFRKALDPDPEKNLLAVPRKQRAMVRKGIKRNLRSEIAPTVDVFYRLYAESVRNLGTPVFSKRYFRTLAEVFGELCETLVVRDGEVPVAGVMSFHFRGEVLPYYGGGSAAARELAANDFMYWEVMRRACERGCGVFDFGRSKLGTGSYAFKKHWGFEPEPLHYEYKLLRRDERPDINPLSPKYRLYVAAWKRLPLALANLIGPWIAKDLG